MPYSLIFVFNFSELPHCYTTYVDVSLSVLSEANSSYVNKKDGYRQQNVRQRQKLISIIDYDNCMTFY